MALLLIGSGTLLGVLCVTLVLVLGLALLVVLGLALGVVLSLALLLVLRGAFLTRESQDKPERERSLFLYESAVAHPIKYMARPLEYFFKAPLN